MMGVNMLPYGVKPDGIIPTVTPREFQIPLAPKQTVVGLVVSNRTDKDILIYDYETTADHAVVVESSLSRRLEFDVPKGTMLLTVILLATEEITTGCVYLERE